MRRDAFALVLLVVAIFAGLAAVGVALGPATSTETRYAEMGREMLVSGDWIIPTLNGAPLLEKPPLEYWVNAAAFGVFGVDDLTARLPSLLAGVLVLLVVAVGARRFAPAGEDAALRRRRGLLGALALTTMPAFLIQAYTISTDIWLVLVTSIAGLCLLESDRTGGRPRLRWVLLLHAMFGLGMLVKGPLTFVLVVVAGVVAAIARRDARPLRPLVHPLGLVVFAAVALPWYLAVDARIPGLLADFVSRRLVGVFKPGETFHSHSVGIVWIPLIGTFPWLAALPGLLRPALRGGGWRRGPVLIALLLAASAPILFSFSRNRLASYASPSFPFLALLVATTWPLGAPSTGPRRFLDPRRQVAFALLGMALAAVGVSIWLVAGGRASASSTGLSIGGATLAVGALAALRPAASLSHPVPRVAPVVLGLLSTMAAAIMTEPFRLPAAKPLWDAIARVSQPDDELGAVLPYTGDWGLLPWNARALVRYFAYPPAEMMVDPGKFAPERFQPAAALEPWFRADARRFLLMRNRDLDRPGYLGGAPRHEVARGRALRDPDQSTALRHRALTGPPMCGIAGIVGAGVGGPEDRSILDRMLATIVHRGPDDGASILGDGFAIGARRLSIVDVAGGRQPVSNDRGDVVVALNGEIYDHEALRRECEARGVRFASRSDTAVLLRLFEDFGAACLDRLEGMYAFAAFDARTRTLLLARDRLGEKPLLWFESRGRIVFASEWRALAAHPDAPRTLDADALALYLQHRFIPAPRTALQGVHRLPPGCALRFADGRAVVAPYWSLPTPTITGEGGGPRTRAEAAREVARLLDAAVASRRAAEVPVGVFLSGGVDSSAIAALARRRGPIETFTLRPADKDFDEGDAAREPRARARHRASRGEGGRGGGRDGLRDDLRQRRRAHRRQQPRADVAPLARRPRAREGGARRRGRRRAVRGVPDVSRRPHGRRGPRPPPLPAAHRHLPDGRRLAPQRRDALARATPARRRRSTAARTPHALVRRIPDRGAVAALPARSEAIDRGRRAPRAAARGGGARDGDG